MTDEQARNGGPLAGKNCVVMGVQNRWSIAYAIGEALADAGARIAVTYVDDRAKRDADALIIEATFLERDADKAAARGHLTAAGAARLARAANVRALCLTHISSRYEQAEVEAEARGIFPDAAVARDFDRITVRAKESVPRGAGATRGPATDPGSAAILGRRAAGCRSRTVAAVC